jgi:hypothetical protein
MLVLLLLHSASLPPFKQFSIPDGFAEQDIDDQFVMACHDLARSALPKVLPEMKSRHPLEVLRARKATGDFGIRFLLEQQQLRIRYLVTVEIPRVEKEDERFITSIKTIEKETVAGEVWADPPRAIVEIGVEGVKRKFGDDVELRNVVAFKTLSVVAVKGLLVLDMQNDLERMLVGVTLLRKFGKKKWAARELSRVY